MNNIMETDVLVIGAGPIGLAAANLLADQGVNVMLVERHPGTSDEPRAISITDESLRVMQQIGIMDRLAPEMLMDTGARYFGRKEQLLAEVRPAGSRLGQPGKSQFDQPVLETLLLEAARDRPRIDIRFNTEAFRITDGPGYVDTVLIDDAGKTHRPLRLGGGVRRWPQPGPLPSWASRWKVPPRPRNGSSWTPSTARRSRSGSPNSTATGPVP